VKAFLLLIGLALVASLCGAQTSAIRCNSAEPLDAAPLATTVELRDLNGKLSRLSDLQGSPAILNFWATWCPPCRRELPWFVALQNKYGRQGLRVVGINMDEPDNPVVARAAAEAGINYPLLFGSPETSLAFIGAQGLPVTLYIGRDGKVRRKVLGIASYEELEHNARELLAPVTQGKRVTVEDSRSEPSIHLSKFVSK
jgi:thiol-disulfide isomerase/thioredoxin